MWQQKVICITVWNGKCCSADNSRVLARPGLVFNLLCAQDQGQKEVGGNSSLSKSCFFRSWVVPTSTSLSCKGNSLM